MKRIAIYPGSFDPLTAAHEDILQRATLLFDQVILAVTDNPTKAHTFPLAERLHKKGFEIVATKGTSKYLKEGGVPVTFVYKVGEGRPDIVDRMKSLEIDMVVLVLRTELAGVVVHILNRKLSADAAYAHGFQFKKDHCAGSVLQQRLVYPNRHISSRTTVASCEV